MGLLKFAGGRVFDPEHGVDGVVQDIFVRDGRIVAAPGSDADIAQEIDCRGRIVMSGAIDMHTHIGGGKLLDKVFHDNGHPRPTDWLGGGENLRAKDFPVMHHSPERFLTCLVLDGVLDRFPGLRIGVIELGASWVPGMLRNLDHAHTSFGRSEPLLQGLSLKPSEFVRRQVRFTPFPFEDAGWLVDQAGPELFMFSTDYPHPEGSWPKTRAHLQSTFSGLPDADIAAMLGENAIAFYGFDRAELAPIAARIGPARSDFNTMTQ